VDVVFEKLKAADKPQMMVLLRQVNMHNIPSVEMPAVSWENYCVARVNGKVIGLCGFRLISEAEAKIELLAVDRNFRRKGVGLKLKVCRLNELTKRGVQTVIVNSDRPESIAWYKKHFGYEEICRLKKEHEFGDPDVEWWTTLKLDLAKWSFREILCGSQLKPD
jgi:ribosomal-protein-alanine N-acetyltransferase